MRKLTLLIGAVLLLALAIVPVAAQDGTILDTAAATPDLSTLVAAVQSADPLVAEALAGSEPLTVFAPTNAAFTKFDGYLQENFGITLEDLLAEQEVLTQVLLYHVTPGNVFSEFLAQSDGGLLPTLQGGSIGVVVREDGGIALNNGVADVIAADIVVSNGVVHLIEDVILNSVLEEQLQGIADRQELGTTISGIAASDDNFSILFAALEAAGLTDVLATGFPFTVFAPTDEAFQAVLDARGLTAEELLADTELLDTILRYHVVSDEVTAEELAELEEVASILDEELPGSGEAISVSVGEEGGITLNGSANVVTADVAADNGLIHVIDAVLVPDAVEEAFARIDFDAALDPDSIAGIALNNEDFSILYEALYASGFAEILETGFPFTVFAPTNAAFEALLADLGLSAEELLADTELLDTVLRYHVISDEVTAEEVIAADGGTIATILNETLPGDGTPIEVAVVDGTVVLNGSVNVTATDIEANNGIVHVIDGVLVPPMGDMSETAEEEPAAEAPAEEEAAEEAAEEPTQTIADIVIASAGAEEAEFTVLLQAVQAADPAILEALSGEGELTVFAPTDEAFGALLDTLGLTIDLVLGQTDALTQILQYHVVAGAVFAEDVVGLDGQDVETLLGETVLVTVTDEGGVTLTDATGAVVNVVQTDIAASNGVIHVIDGVLIPASIAALLGL